MGLNDYLLVVKHPMNLLKVLDRLKAREYKTVEEVLDHIQLIWDNCKDYNQSGVIFDLYSLFMRLVIKWKGILRRWSRIIYLTFK